LVAAEDARLKAAAAEAAARAAAATRAAGTSSGTGTDTPSPAPVESATPAETPTSTDAQTTERWSTRQPFRSEAFSNTSVGTGLVTDRRNVMTSTLKSNSTALNSARWSVPVYEAVDSDPTWTIVDDNGRSFTLKIPAAAAPTDGTDQHMSVTQPDQRTDFEMWGASENVIRMGCPICGANRSAVHRNDRWSPSVGYLSPSRPNPHRRGRRVAHPAHAGDWASTTTS
jgi:hypothetical protein